MEKRTMDTGKIMMGTALLLLMIGLVMHPANALPTGDAFQAHPETVICGFGQTTIGSDISGVPGPGSSIPATHPYERLNTSTRTSSSPDQPEITG